MSKQLLTRIIRVNSLVRNKSTGSPKQLAKKLDISERSLYELMGIMKQFGAPIKYSKSRESYFYISEGDFIITFQSK